MYQSHSDYQFEDWSIQNNMDMDMHPSPDKMDIPSSTPSTLAYLLDLPILVGLEDGLDVVELPVGFPVGCLLFFVGFFSWASSWAMPSCKKRHPGERSGRHLS